MLLFGINEENNIGTIPLPDKNGVKRSFTCYPQNKVEEHNQYVEYVLDKDNANSERLAIYKMASGISVPVYYVLYIPMTEGYPFKDIVEYLKKMVKTHVVVFDGGMKCFMTKTVGEYVKEMMTAGHTYDAVKYHRQQKQDHIRRALLVCMRRHYQVEKVDGVEMIRELRDIGYFDNAGGWNKTS